MARNLAVAIDPFAGAAASVRTSDAVGLGGAADLTLQLQVTSASTFTAQLSNAASPTETDWTTHATYVVASGSTAHTLPAGYLQARVIRSTDANTVRLGKNYR